MFWSGYGPCNKCLAIVRWRRCKAKPVCCKIPFDKISNGGGIHPCWSIPHGRKKGMSNSDILIAAIRDISSDMWGAKLRFWLSLPRDVTGLSRGDILSAIKNSNLDDDSKRNMIRGFVGDLGMIMLEKGFGNAPQNIEMAAESSATDENAEMESLDSWAASPATYERLTRPEQRKFRERVIRAYGGSCAITGESCNAVLEAAHLPGRDHTQHNLARDGILLRIDLHRLLDTGLMTFTAKGIIQIIREAGAEYRKLHGQTIRFPKRKSDHPTL